jgi:glutathione peroxidase
MRCSMTALMTVLVCLWSVACGDNGGNRGAAANDAPASAANQEKVVVQPLRHTVKSIQGEDVDLAARYRGKVVLFVNVASKCGYTKQYADLQALHEKYAERGLAVLGFPCNQFGGQEPGTEQQIQEFCSTKFSVTFDLFSKVEVNGDTASPLFKDLTNPQASVSDAGPVKWNFEKFLVDRQGRLIARYRSGTKPMDEKLVSAVEKALAEPAPAE